MTFFSVGMRRDSESRARSDPISQIASVVDLSPHDGMKEVEDGEHDFTLSGYCTLE